MLVKPRGTSLALAWLLALPLAATAETFVIPFSDIREEIDTSSGDPDEIIRAYLAGLIRDELDAQGFNVDGGLVFGEIPIDAMTETIQTDCDFPQPYKVHTDATTATVTLDDTSSLTLALETLRSIQIIADLTGVIDAEADAWVRWGQDVPFVGDCKTITTDHGWVGLTLPMAIDLTLDLTLDPTYDAEQVALVVDKHAVLSGQAQITGGNLRHDFGPISLTDVVLDVFEDELLEALSVNGEEAAAESIVRMNYKLDGRDEDGLPDPTIEPFNGPTTYVLSTDPDDQDFIRGLLAELGIPEIVLEMVDERGVEILLQLVVLEGAEQDAYLASLGAEVGCDALLGTYQASLPTTPLYTQTAQGCAVADLSAPAGGGYFTDTLCTDEIAFSPTDSFAYCQAQFGPGAETDLGNAASWVPDADQPGDVLPTVPSRAWTTVPTTTLDLGVLPVAGNHQPFMKQVHYATIDGVGRGTNSCELEMRVYKRDIAERGLRPLLALHGGTWQSRVSSFLGLETGISQLTERGFVVFAPFYRLVGDTGGNVECNGASWREVTADAETALDWVRQNGVALGAIDGPVNVFGQSAGAHLAAWLAANRPGDVRKAALNYGPTDILEFLAGAVPLGGPYEAYRAFGLKSLSRFFGSQASTADLRLELVDFAGLTPAALAAHWATLIPDTVFDLTQIDPLAPPVYVARCAASTGIDLTTINPALPPAVLLACMKQDLRDFLVANSFNHQLATEAVPVFSLHGSGDTIVPHAQAVNLCAAIDGSVLSADVIDPLTIYDCGINSEAHIVRDADHAFELGVCIAPYCPAGASGSDTRVAAAAAINASYAWLQQDPVPDTDGDGIGDDVDTDDDDDGITDDWEIANGLDPLDATDAFLDNDVDGLNNLGEFLAGTDPNNADTDGDNVLDGFDNCAALANADQRDADRDEIGNACDSANDVAPFDYTGDGRSDILWRNGSTGQSKLYEMNGASIAANISVGISSYPDWKIAGGGDYNGDGKADILWRNTVSGQNWMYLMDGSTIVSSVSVNTVSDANWQVVGNGDYNGDGKSDILWRNVVSGQNWMYLMDSAVIVSSVSVNTVPTIWEIAGNGDYNGDGKSDILWRHGGSGQNWMYLLDGAIIDASSGVNTVADLNWQIAGNGDYDGDGKSDILWRNNATGQNWMYLMDGSSIMSSVGVHTVPDTNWQVAGDGDYNGDGKADILWRHGGSGQNWMYLMNGASIDVSVGVNTVSSHDWQIVYTN